MKRLFKWILTLSGLLALLLVVLVGIAFVVFDSDNLKKQLATTVKQKTSANLDIGQELSLGFFPWLKITTGDIRLSNPQGFPEKMAALEVDKLDASIKLMPLFKGQIEIGSIALDGTQLNLIRDRKGRSNMDVLISNVQKSVETNEAKGSQSDKQSEKAATDISNLSISEISLDNFTLNQYDPRQNLTQTFILDHFTTSQFAFGHWTPINASGNFKSGSGKTEARWQLETDLRITKGMNSIEMRNLSAAMTDMGNKLDQLKLSGDTKVDLSNDNTQLTHKGSIELDGQPLQMDLAATFSTFKDINLSLKADNFDVRPWMAAEDSPQASSNDKPLDTKPIADFLKRARIKGDIQLASLNTGKVNLQSVSGKLSNKGATLWLKPFSAKAFQGDLSTVASINFGAKPLALSIQPNLQKIEVGEAIGQLFDVERLSGLGNLDLNMTTKGLSLKDMLANLNGTGSMDLSDGALLGIDMAKVIETGISLQLLQGTDAYKGKTNFAALKGKFKADEGVIHLNNLALTSPLFDLVGRALTDSHKESLAGNFKLQLKGVLKEKLEQKYPQLVGVDLPFELKGTWSEPKPSIDFESLLKAKYKAELDNKLDAEKAKAQAKLDAEKEKAKDKLEDELKKKLLDKLKF